MLRPEFRSETILTNSIINLQYAVAKLPFSGYSR